MLISFDHDPEHFTCFQARLIYKTISDVEELWERDGNNLVEIPSILSRFEPVDTTYSQ